MHEGIVISGPKDKPKSRDHKLFVNTNNPLIIIPKELEQFENAFFVLLRKTVDTLEVHSDSPFSYNLISRPLFLFYEMVNVYLILALCNWPRTVLEKDTLQKLYTVVFTKLGEIHFVSMISSNHLSSQMQFETYNRVCYGDICIQLKNGYNVMKCAESLVWKRYLNLH